MGEKTTVYLNLDAEYLTKTKEQAQQRSVKEHGTEDGEQGLFYPELLATIQEAEIEDDVIHVSFDTPMGYLSFAVPIDEAMALAMIELTVKRLNRFRTAIEALK